MWVEDHWTSLSWTGSCANSRGDKRNVYPLWIKNGGPSKHTISFKPSLVCWWVPWGFTGAWEGYLQARECLKHRGVTSRSHHSVEDDSGKLQTSSPRASVCRHNLTTALQPAAGRGLGWGWLNLRWGSLDPSQVPLFQELASELGRESHNCGIQAKNLCSHLGEGCRVSSETQTDLVHSFPQISL